MPAPTDLASPSRPGSARARFGHSEAGAIFMALLVGAGAGGGAVGFRYMILGFTELFTGHRDYSLAGHAANPLLPGLGGGFLLLVPVLGGLLYGPLVSRFAPEARGHGVPEVMYAVDRNGGRMRVQVPLVKSLASAICIGCGGSVGREGPIVQIGAALGSVMGQALRLPESRLRLLVACGAAGGIAATFNAPIAGVLFSLELILRDFEARSFGLVVLSSVVADAVGRAAFGSHPFLALPAFHLGSAVQLFLYAGLGVLASAVGIGFMRLLYGGEDLADRLWGSRPQWLRPAAGGVLLGLLLFAVPEMYGVGYPVLDAAVAGRYALAALVGLLAAKMLATSLTMWIGGSGGVFAPSLFMGAMLGSAYGEIAHHLLPGLASAPGAYGLVGMAAVFAAASRAPMTAVIIVFELTGDYQVILPLMVAVVTATALANAVTAETIYTLKLRRRGSEVGTSTPRLDRIRVLEAMGPAPAPTGPDAGLQELVSRFQEETISRLPVLDRDGTLLGVVEAAALERALAAGEEGSASDLLRFAASISADASLHSAIRTLALEDADGIPVLAAGSERLVGWLTHRDVLLAYSSAAGGGKPAPPAPPSRLPRVSAT